MKRIVIITAACCAVFASCRGRKNPENFTALDSLAYASGVQFGSEFRMQDTTLNGDVIGASFTDVLDRRSMMTLDEANTFINEWFSVRMSAMDPADIDALTGSVRHGRKAPGNFTTIDSLSYAAGVRFGTEFMTRDSTLNSALVGAGVADAYAQRSLIPIDEAYRFLHDWFMVRMPAKAAVENREWFDRVKADEPDIRTTESGLMYKITDEGDPAIKAIDDADRVMVDYILSLRDGNVVQRNDSIVFPLNRVIRAWTEGMKLVGKGGEITLWVPAELGYGAQGSGTIPANSALKFEIRLLDVIPAREE